MQTITLQEPGRFAYTETPAQNVLQPGEALVRVGRIGICGTDLHAYWGRQPFFTYPRILGHELGGGGGNRRTHGRPATR
jgi:alcohol dehydrogenase